ncbi:UNVERIFIED_ORG: ribosomal protein S27AE [Microbispora rosea subsp. rosea]
MRDNICPKCSSGAVMAGVEVRDRGPNGPQPLRVRVEEPLPAKVPFFHVQGEALGTIRAWICASCGFTELYTDNLNALYEAYRKGAP